MLTDLRNSLGLTRQELADTTGRSINYLLKAEQLTFPSIPPTLVDYYSKHLTIPPNILRDAYRDAQRKQRSLIFNHVIPRPAPTPNFSFCRKWLLVDQLHENDEPGEPDSVSPSQYAMSKWLCVPASAIYFATKYPAKYPASLHVALSDIKEALSDGTIYAQFADYAEAQRIHNDFLRIVEEVSK